MSEFTKEELIKLKNGIDYLPNSVNMSTQYLADCVVIMQKLDKMIDNYCEHDSKASDISFTNYFCTKCGKEIV